MERGHLRQRGNSFEIRAYAGVEAVTGKARYVTRTVRGTRKDAERELTQLLADLDVGKVTPGTRRTFEDAATKWLDMAVPDMSPGTVVTTEDLLKRYLFPSLGHLPVSQIHTEHLDSLYGRLRRKGPAGRPLSASTVSRIHGIAHRVLEQARRWNWIPTNRLPMRPHRPSPSVVPPRLMRVRLPSSWRGWGSAIPTLPLYLRLAAIVGARRGELCAVRWSAVDLDGGMLAIGRRLAAGRNEDGREVVFEREGTKRNAGHDVALDPSTVAMLRAHRKECMERALACGVRFRPDGFVFSVEPDGGAGWRPHSVMQRFRRLRQRAGLLDSIRLHDLRHFVASICSTRAWPSPPCRNASVTPVPTPR
jgi:integrase